MPGQLIDGGSIVVNGIRIKYIDSLAAGTPAIKYRAIITLSGPRNGRGVAWITAGFIQNVVQYVNQGYYSTENKTLASNMESLAPFLDTNSGTPWYSTDVTAIIDAGTKPVHPYTSDIRSEDSPALGPPLTFDQGSTVVAGDDILDVIDTEVTFRLDVCASTVDTRNEANFRYPRQATAQWKFKATGSIAQAPLYAWTPGTGSGIILPNTWLRVTDGEEPVVYPPTAEELAAEEYWNQL